MNTTVKITAADAGTLTGWFKENQRILPWRNTGNPYDVWLSEIMLQQTRVEFVKERFILFKQQLPDIASLASCSEDRLLKLWEGMGYYSRVRNLQKCARVLMEQYDGILPGDPARLMKLTGIGPYTAGAIASIAFGIPVPAVDGNVLRVLARRFAVTDDIRSTDTRTAFEQAIRSFYEQDGTQYASDPAFCACFTQSLMELGALVCVPNGEPHCEQCPWKASCKAHLNHQTDEIPYRSPLKQRNTVERTLLIIRDGDRFLLHKRPSKGLLAGLYVFYGVEQKLVKPSEVTAAVTALVMVPIRIHRLPDSRHIFTHLEWHMTAWEIKTASLDTLLPDDFMLVNKKELASFAVPSAFHTYTEYYSLKD